MEDQFEDWDGVSVTEALLEAEALPEAPSEAAAEALADADADADACVSASSIDETMSSIQFGSDSCEPGMISVRLTVGTLRCWAVCSTEATALLDRCESVMSRSVPSLSARVNFAIAVASGVVPLVAAAVH